MFKSIFASILLILTSNAFADEVLATVGSIHYTTRSEKCEFNPGIGYQWDTGQEIMFFKNSDCNAAMYGGQAFWPVSREFLGINMRLGGHVGLATGYDRAVVVPFVLGGAKLQFTRNFGMDVVTFPHPDSPLTAIFRYKID